MESFPRRFKAVLLKRVRGRYQRPGWAIAAACVVFVAAVLCTRTRAIPWFPIARAASVTTSSSGIPAPAPRVFHGHRLEPLGGAILHGGGPVGEASFNDYRAALSAKPPMLTSSDVDLHDDLPTFFTRLRQELDRADGAGERGLLVPEIGLTFNAGDAGRHYEARVAGGLDDDRLQALLHGLRQLNRPVFLRPGYGFNGVESGYGPQAYVAAFRQIARAVRDAELDQVALVWEWSPDAELEFQEMGARESEAAMRWLSYYPGDDVVDWWGIDLFSEPGISGSVTTDFLAEAELRGFPVIVAQSMPKGHDTGEGNFLLESWYRPYFDRIATSAAIKAVTYLDRNWREYPQWTTWGDGRVEADPSVLSFVRDRLSRPAFAGLQTRQHTEELLHLRTLSNSIARRPVVIPPSRSGNPAS